MGGGGQEKQKYGHLEIQEGKEEIGKVRKNKTGKHNDKGREAYKKKNHKKGLKIERKIRQDDGAMAGEQNRPSIFERIMKSRILSSRISRNTS